MKTKIIISILLLSLFISSALGAWTKITQWGTWTSSTRTNFSKTTDAINDGFLRYRNTQNNFYGYDCNVSFGGLYTTKPWYEVGSSQCVDIRINLTDQSNNVLLAKLNFVSQITLWGAVWGRSADFGWGIGTTTTLTDWNQIPTGGGLWNHQYQLTPELGRMVITKYDTHVEAKGFWVNETLNGGQQIGNPVGQTYAWGSDKPMNITTEFDNVTLTLDVYHWGSGHFESGIIDDSIKTTLWNPNLIPYIPFETAPFSIWTIVGWFQYAFKVFIPPQIYDFIVMLGGWFAPFITIIQMIWGIFLTFVGVLPYMFMFYVIDVLLTSLATHSVQPIGALGMLIYNTISGIVGTISGIIQAIRSVLPIP